jgi:hypothetical protein
MLTWGQNKHCSGYFSDDDNQAEYVGSFRYTQEFFEQHRSIDCPDG